MRALRNLREPLLAALLWSAMALACIGLRDGLGAAMLLWLPAGVAVAAFYATPRNRWPVLAAVLLPVQAGTVWLTGMPMQQAIAFCAAALVQSTIAAQIGRMVLGGRRQVPHRFRHVAGLFAAALLGSLAGALVAFAFQAGQTINQLSSWFLANALGILTLAPVILLLRQELHIGARLQRFKPDRSMISFMLGCSICALIALQIDHLALQPLLFAGVVMATVRYGQIAPLLVILIYAGVGTALSIMKGSPTPFMEATAAEATVMLQSWLLAMLATVLPIAAMLLKRQDLQCELVRRNAEMRSSLMLFNLAEDTAGMGRWWLNLRTGEQDWSPKMLELNGLSRSLAPDPGDVRSRLPDGGEEVFRQIALNRDTSGTYSFIYRIRPPNQLERILRMAMRNEFDGDGERFAVFGVAVDVTRQVRRENALEAAHARAVQLAAEAQKLANTDPLTRLPNRRCTFDRLETMAVFAENSGTPFSVILFDIDHFKTVNDLHGHQAGDAVLQDVAEISRQHARRADIVGRVGGEEFLWLVADTPQRGVRQLAERLRTSVEQGRAGSSLPKVTVSMGLAHFREGDTCQSLLARADAALYRAKDSGRNRVKRAA